ncbi:hypothetical protein D3C83_01770 [compost metagenome]
MAERGDIAPEELSELGEWGRLCPEREPGEEGSRLGGQASAAGGEQLLFGELVAAADVGHELFDRRSLGPFGFRLEHRSDEIFLTDDAGIGFSTIERFVVPLGLAVIDEAGIAGAGKAGAGAELPEHPVRRQPGQVIASEISPVAAVGVSRGLPDHPSAHRVEVDVANQGEPVGISIDEVSLEAAFEQVTNPLEPCVEVAGVAEGKVLHADGQRAIASLKGEVQMIGHQAEGVDPVAVTLDPFSEEFVEALPVFLLEENVLARIAAQDNVIEATGHVEARFASHESA